MTSHENEELSLFSYAILMIVKNQNLMLLVTILHPKIAYESPQDD